ncbi:DUF1302 domain-containing protein [Aestuariirhabdus litorea]|uniref:DUF1302 domain-containing protein n=2 Tax=Aestuariirhabdus litorea TaxID=2528527 RepID=A0A3P3VPF2_9GAMM|nr:DUF1302 domain-containing protein [Aestuariirhabdus litorea]RWW93701.1 DUF1302 family protein [Endozoicomonadaceae bacterium GTF-13]
MRNSSRTWHQFTRLPLAAAVTAAVLSSQAQAISFELMDGEIRGNFDSTLSYGVSWAAADADKDYYSNNSKTGGRAFSSTTDDGKLNYKKGQRFSEVVKGIHDLELTYGDSGVFVRGKYWYDFEQRRETEFIQLSDKGKPALSQSKGAELLDYYVWHNYELFDQPGTVRLGSQVVSWGESTFIQNSINSANPIDVSAFRKPGAEIKEGLMPLEMLYVQQGLSDTLSLEAFYQFEWKPTTLDNCGTFFGTDTVTEGCNDRMTVAVQSQGLKRAKDDEPSDDGQWGAAIRWYAEELGETEFGAYFMNYHSRLPSLGFGESGDKADILGDPVFDALFFSQYQVQYPEDIRLYGLSFATTLGQTAVSGEVSYRPNQPLTTNTVDSLLALVEPFTQLGVTGLPYSGEGFNAYRRKEVTQAQVTAIHFFDQVLGASRVSLVAEAGANWIGGLDDPDKGGERLGRHPVYGPGADKAGACLGLAAQFGSPAGDSKAQCHGDGYYSDFSWGYRARVSAKYNDVFAGINMTPSVAFSHDVDGWGQNFNEGRKAVSVGLTGEYLNTYKASVSYTDFFGGDYNTSTDRDFFAASVSASF